jgi:2-polyprenyl-3-methyl-5-hydroxy-6-metoxy-1,4-benzoquinol methylase
VQKEDIQYFNRGDYENPRFWRRMVNIPDLNNKKVLDLGCGHGSMCIYMALKGARKVIGLDINNRLIEFAKENVKKNYPQLEDKIEFVNVGLEEYSDCNFDYIVSYSTLEHVIYLKRVMEEVKKHLKVGGKFYAGFGPLYNTPFGDHRLTKTVIPWGHLIVPEKLIIKRLNKNSKTKINSICDLGVNKLSYCDYKLIFKIDKMKILYFKTNHVNRADGLAIYTFSQISSMLCKIKLLEEYFTFNIYMIMENEG